MQNEKIIQAIAAYLEENTAASGYYEEVQFSRSGGRANHAGFCEEIAREIAAAIAPHLEAGAGWEDAPDWANYKTIDSDSMVTFWEHEPIIDLSDGTWYRKSGNRLVVDEGKTIGSHKIFEKRPR